MSLVKVDNLRFNYYDKELYQDVSFQINQGEHAVLIGQNGSGKTTLFDLLVGKLDPDKGSIYWTPGVKYSYLDQHYKQFDDFTVREFLEQVYSSLFKKEALMNELYLKGSDSNDPNYLRYIEQASSINEELIRLDFYSVKEEIDKILSGLGISRDYLDTKLIKLSSGQREKVYLAKMLLEKSDLLLLDEPTNYLDAIYIAWLKDYLNKYPKAFLIISHDEAFCESVANVVFHLHNCVIDRYKGDYKYFKEQSVIRKEQYEKDYAAQQRYIKKEEDFIAAHIVRATSAKAAKSRRARLAHLERMEPPKNDTNKVFISFPYSGDIGQKILEIDSLVIGYNKPLLQPITFSIRKGDKICVVGKNGIGKTTFVKTLLNIIPSLGGKYEFNDRVKIGYFSQTELDDLSLTPVQYIKSFYPNMTPLEIRNALARCGVKSNLAIKPLTELSGGEEAKTRLALLTIQKTNVLILDEPTNHLDKIAKESLKEAILEYPGVVIAVSHEKDFTDIFESILSFE